MCIPDRRLASLKVSGASAAAMSHGRRRLVTLSLAVLAFAPSAVARLPLPGGGPEEEELTGADILVNVHAMTPKNCGGDTYS